MTTQATVLLTWSVLYVFAALLYVVAFTRRDVEPELPRFGYVCIAFAVLSSARMLYVLGTEPSEHLWAGQVSAAGRYLLGATCVALCESLARAPSKLPAISIFWAGLGLALIATGVHGDLSADGSSYETYPPGATMFAFGLALAAAALLDAVRHRGYDPYVRRVVGAATICLLAAFLDAALALTGLLSLDVLAHAGVAGVVMVHWTMLDRFGEATQRLASRRAAYAESLEDLSKKHDELLETEQLAAVGELSAVIAHEVRNPLAVIRNATSAMRKGSYGPEAERKLLDILDEETERLLKLTFELGAFAKHAKPSACECEIAPLFDRAVQLARSQRSEERSRDEVRFETHAEIATIIADRELLERSLAYLVQNAIDASPAGATVRLEARETQLDGEDAVEIAVVDEGEGMDSSTLEKAATPFFTTRSRGTGLALAIVSRIASNHGGRLDLESEAGRGTTAKLILPRQRPSLVPSIADLSIGIRERTDQPPLA